MELKIVIMSKNNILLEMSQNVLARLIEEGLKETDDIDKILGAIISDYKKRSLTL
jgi:hypothetical protein